MGLKEKLKNPNGITTIVLVIAIVVVLLLATVTITLGVKLNGNTKSVKTGNTKTTQITSKDQLGTKVTAEQIAKNPEKYYGQEVKNYTKGDRVYRVFYVDTEGYFGEKNTIYLKADWVAIDINLKDRGAHKYTPKTTKVLEKMNQQWAKERLNANWNENEHCAAYLCDPTTKDASSNQEWASYFDEKKANYVIGSPSVEMYVKSYNQVPHTVGNSTLGALYRETNYPGYIYTLNKSKSTISNSDDYSGDKTLDYLGYNSMYCGKNGAIGSYHTWLTSPSSWGSTSMCCVNGYTAALFRYFCNYTSGVSPIVSLKSDFTPEI